MTDDQHLQSLLLARYPSIAIVTAEEDDALELVSAAAIESRLDMLVWSESTGIRDWLLKDSATIADTEHPAAALYCLTSLAKQRRILVTLDLASHLSKDDR